MVLDLADGRGQLTIELRDKSHGTVHRASNARSTALARKIENSTTRLRRSSPTRTKGKVYVSCGAFAPRRHPVGLDRARLTRFTGTRRPRAALYAGFRRGLACECRVHRQTPLSACVACARRLGPRSVARIVPAATSMARHSAAASCGRQRTASTTRTNGLGGSGALTMQTTRSYSFSNFTINR